MNWIDLDIIVLLVVIFVLTADYQIVPPTTDKED